MKERINVVKVSKYNKMVLCNLVGDYFASFKEFEKAFNLKGFTTFQAVEHDKRDYFNKSELYLKAEDFKHILYSYKDKITNEKYNVQFDYEKSQLVINGRVFKVVEDKNYEFVYKFQKTQIKSTNGIKGLHMTILRWLGDLEFSYNRLQIREVFRNAYHYVKPIYELES